ncbi:hypothetical protein CR513_55824, partial [Mucuna pruriens]
MAWQNNETGLLKIRRSIKERKHAIPDDYIVFLQEYEDDIGLTEDDSINFYQAMQSSNTEKWIDAMKDEMKSMQDNDILRDRSQDILKLLQENYISKALDRFDMKDSKPRDTLIAKRDKFSLKQCPNNDLEKNEMQKILYASTVGSPIYAQVCTRPNIAFVVGVLGSCNVFIVNVQDGPDCIKRKSKDK